MKTYSVQNSIEGTNHVVQNEYFNMNLIPTCPYCGFKFEGTPSRKDTCPGCQRVVYLRNLPDDNTYRLYSDSAVKMIDRVWENLEVVEKFNKDLPAGYDLISGWDKWFNKYKSKAEPYEYIWFMLSEWILDLAESQDFLAMKSIYEKMALLYNEQGKDAYSFRKEALRMDLLHNQKIGEQNNTNVTVKIECEGEVCDQCAEHYTEEFSIGEVLDKMPIPSKKCTNRSSECRYVYQISG